LNRLRVTDEFDRQKDGQTDIILANAAPNNAARTKNLTQQ